MSSTATEACRVCGGVSLHSFRQPLLGRTVSYFDCPQCGYFQTESPDWLAQAYESAINDVDTGIMARNRMNVDRVIMTLAAIKKLDGRVIDHAGGYGILVRMLRDGGVDAWWRDKYCQNLVARGFESTDERCDLVTAFEVFEHMIEPMRELTEMLQHAPAVLLSTELILSTAAPAPDWWYLGPEHGQHVGFFRTATLEWMASKLGCHQASDGTSLHLFSQTPIPSYWRLLIRLKRFASIAARFAPPSRTMRDFELLRKRQRPS